MQHKLKGGKCVGCGTNLDGASNADNAERGPQPGDPTVCAYCGTIMEFDENLDFRKMTEDEIDALPPTMRVPLREARKRARRRNVK